MVTFAPSALLVALVQTAPNLPVFLLGVPAGAIGDIIDRRKILIVSQGLILAAAGILGLLTVTGKTGPWTLLWLTFALAHSSTLTAPASQPGIPTPVPTSPLPPPAP